MKKLFEALTPRKILLFGLCVITVIFVISAVFPGGWKTEIYTLRIPDYRTLFQEDTVKYKDIRTVIASVDTTDYEIPSGNDSIRKDVDRINAATDSIQKPETRTTQPSTKLNPKPETRNPNGASLNEVKPETPFEYPDGQDTLLFPLFRIINHTAERNKPVRILHYGDSQIEGDRVTSTIRNYMQKKYGGQGIGFIPIVPANKFCITFQQDISPHWKRFSVLNKNNSTSNKRFGIAGNFVRYSSANENDSIAHIGLKPYYIGYRNVRTFTQARLFYGTSEKPLTIVVNQSNMQQMMTDDVVSSAWWMFGSPQNALDLSLISSTLPDLYGIALDGDHGVAVDNMPLRGSSGIEFSRMDTAQMGQMFRMMDVQMLIWQFGTNVVPHIVGSYDFYARRMVQELRMLKAMKPGLVIVVIGVNDMSQNTPNGYQSYPNIVKIRDAQKKAAFEAGCVFWDLYEAMGGANSMPSWVFAKPSLAQKDFVHFSVSGAKIVAELFCKAWTKEYQMYIDDCLLIDD